MPSDDLIRNFMERTEKRFDLVDARLITLLEFKWQIIGGSIVASGILSIFVNAIFVILGGK